MPLRKRYISQNAKLSKAKRATVQADLGDAYLPHEKELVDSIVGKLTSKRHVFTLGEIKEMLFTMHFVGRFKF